MKPHPLISLIALVIFLSSCYNDKEDLLYPKNTSADCSNTDSKYSTAIKSIFQTKCAGSSGCHGSGSLNTELITYANISGKKNQILNRVYASKDMPPSGSPQLSETEKVALKCWLDQGAPDN